MKSPLKLRPRSFYDFLPAQGHSCGDIWRGLPSGGLLGPQSIMGIVVTPACDLTQRKAETITYLPIIPVRAYFSTLGMLPEINNRIQGLLQAGQIAISIPWQVDRFVPPTTEQLTELETRIAAHLAAKQRGTKEIAALQRAQCWSRDQTRGRARVRHGGGRDVTRNIYCVFVGRVYRI